MNIFPEMYLEPTFHYLFRRNYLCRKSRAMEFVDEMTNQILFLMKQDGKPFKRVPSLHF